MCVACHDEGVAPAPANIGARARALRPGGWLVIVDETYPFSRLKGGANVLVFPELQSANAAYKLVWRLANADAIVRIWRSAWAW